MWGLGEREWEADGLLFHFSPSPPSNSCPTGRVYGSQIGNIRIQTGILPYQGWHEVLTWPGLVHFHCILVVSVRTNEDVFGMLFNSTSTLSINKIPVTEGGYVSHQSYLFASLSWRSRTSLEPVATGTAVFCCFFLPSIHFEMPLFYLDSLIL